MGNWADLPIEILDEMLTQLLDIEDLIRFRAVCHSWRCASLENKNTNNSFGPWMMLSEPEHPHKFLDGKTVMLTTMFNQDEESESNKDGCCNEVDKGDVEVPPRMFLNVSNKNKIELHLPEALGRRCFGSKFGWVLTIGVDRNIHLLNPLTRLQTPFPPQSTFECQYIPSDAQEPYEDPHGESDAEYIRTIYIEKFALSSHPNHNHHHGVSFVLMVIYSQDRILAIARPGDSAWTDVKYHRTWFDDVIFFNNHFYAVQHLGDLVVCDITSPVPVATDFMPPPVRLIHSYRYYLVEMCGHLHLVVRMYTPGEDILGDYFSFTSEFKVYTLDFSAKKWIQLQDLGDHALFLGNNASFAISHPDLRSNSIYFTDDFTSAYEKTNCDMGLFDFGEKKIIDSIHSHSADGVRSTFSPPLFFIPNLH